MKIIWTLLLLLSFAGELRAADWSETNIQYLSGSNYLRPNTDRYSQSIITVEHISGWAYGNNFFFFDIQQPDTQDKTVTYGEISPAFSLGKMDILKVKDRFIKDILLQLNLEFPTGPARRVNLSGVTIEWQNLWFDYFATQFLHRDVLGVEGTSQQLTLVWSKVFGPEKWPIRFNGFLDWAGAEGHLRENLQMQPSLLLDLAKKTNNKVPLRIGMEYNFWQNKYGIKGLNQSVPQFKAVWIF